MFRQCVKLGFLSDRRGAILAQGADHPAMRFIRAFPRGHRVGPRLFTALAVLAVIPLTMFTGLPEGLTSVGAAVSTVITPGVGVGPVRLGMSVAQVTALLGLPMQLVQNGQLIFSQWAMTVTVESGIVVRVSTTSPLFRTTWGAGVGISHRQATQLVGDSSAAFAAETLTDTGNSMTALYPFQGIGFVFRADRAVEVFVMPPLVMESSTLRILPETQASSQPARASNVPTGGAASGGGVAGGGGAAPGGGMTAGGGSAGAPNAASPSAAGPVPSAASSSPSVSPVPPVSLVVAPPWSGIIDRSRAVNWAGTRVGATIVNRTTQCGPTIPPYNGPASTINSALASCSNGYVLLGPGTFTLSTGINFGATNNVTLRGSGPLQTILNFTGGDPCGGNGGDICAGNSSAWYIGNSQVQYGAGCAGGSAAPNWTGGYAQGSTQITLSCTTGLAAGMTLVLDQVNDASDTNGVFVCSALGPCSTESPGGFGRAGREQVEMKQLVAVNGNVVTIFPGLYNTNWRAAQSPGAWWLGPNSAPGEMLSGVGIENLTANHTSSTSVQAGIFFLSCHNCWVKNVRGINSNRNQIWCYQSSNITVRDSYFYGTQNAAAESYGFEGAVCADSLLENNIFQHLAASIMMGGPTSGTVIAYNYNLDDYYVAGGWQMPGEWNHSAGNSFNLWEGNEGPGMIADDIHGTHNQETFFRNRFVGLDTCSYGPPCGAQTVPFMIYTHSRGFNLIGNVLGCTFGGNDCTGFTVGCFGCSATSYYANYEDNYAAGTSANQLHTIYALGYCGDPGNESSSGCGSLANDALTPTTLLRWGNYDTATNTVRWNSSEVPTSAVPYINGTSVPTTHVLAPSYYLSSQPVWWGVTGQAAIPWPPIGPDVTGGAGPGGYAYHIPAAACFTSTARDGSNPYIAFDANKCYP